MELRSLTTPKRKPAPQPGLTQVVLKDFVKKMLSFESVTKAQVILCLNCQYIFSKFSPGILFSAQNYA